MLGKMREDRTGVNLVKTTDTHVAQPSRVNLRTKEHSPSFPDGPEAGGGRLGTKSGPVYRSALQVVILFPFFSQRRKPKAGGRGHVLRGAGQKAARVSDPGPITSQLVTLGE